MHDREAHGRTNGDAAVLEAIRSIRYGSVEIIIHEGRIVAKPGHPNAGG